VFVLLPEFEAIRLSAFHNRRSGGVMVLRSSRALLMLKKAPPPSFGWSPSPRNRGEDNPYAGCGAWAAWISAISLLSMSFARR
jgi:hypothetical protein